MRKKNWGTIIRELHNNRLFKLKTVIVAAPDPVRLIIFNKIIKDFYCCETIADDSDVVALLHSDRFIFRLKEINQDMTLNGSSILRTAVVEWVNKHWFFSIPGIRHMKLSRYLDNRTFIERYLRRQLAKKIARLRRSKRKHPVVIKWPKFAIGAVVTILAIGLTSLIVVSYSELEKDEKVELLKLVFGMFKLILDTLV